MSYDVDLRLEQADLAVGRLTTSINTAAVIIILISLLDFVWDAHLYPNLGLSITAWGLLAAMIGVNVCMSVLGRTQTTWLFIAFMLGGAAVIALDIVGTGGGRLVDVSPAAAAGVSALLLTFVTTRSTWEILTSTGVLCLILVVLFALNIDGDPILLAPNILVILLAATPPILGVTISRAFHKLVQIESDHVRVQTAVAVPHTSVGMLASGELARLDLDAERLLDEVGSGAAMLPLNPEAAAFAGELATNLRLHLIAGRGRTWLYHAISESAVLGPIVTVSDPQGYATLMPTARRDALLSAVWLVAGDLSRPTQTLRVEVREVTGIRSARRISIVFEANGVPRKQVDAAAWQAIGKVGRYVESIRGDALCVDIDCELDSSAK